MANIYLTYNNGKEVLELPVLPEKLEVVEVSDNDSYTIQNIGQITVLNPRKPGEVTIESFFPANNAPYVTSKVLYDPAVYVETIRRWRDSQNPIRLTVSKDIAVTFGGEIDRDGNPLLRTMACSIENFTYQEVAGSVGDIGYSLKLKEYRFYTVKTATIDEEAGTLTVTEERTSEKELPISYTVQSGDTLYAIAKKQLGDGELYKEIAEKNGITNVNLIYPGQVLYFD